MQSVRDRPGGGIAGQKSGRHGAGRRDP